jgi:hypothetical protein
MARSFQTRITTTGPFFTRDPAKTLSENIHTMMKAIASEGATDVRGQMRMGENSRAPVKALGTHVSSHVVGELRRYPVGPNYSLRVIVRNRGLSRAQGISLMAAASYVEGATRAFAKTRRRIMAARAINTAELTRGLQ